MLATAIILQSVLFNRSAHADLKLHPCSHVAACALIYGAVAGVCVSACGSTTVGNPAGLQLCYACIAGQVGGAYSFIEYCWNNSEACAGPIADWYFSNNTYPPTVACGNYNCTACCLENSNKWCRDIDTPDKVIGGGKVDPIVIPGNSYCSESYYSLCFKSCACPSGSDLRVREPRKGKSSPCYIHKNDPIPPRPPNLPAIPSTR